MKSKKYKAKFVANGFSQRKAVDYKETFSPRPRLSIVKVHLCLRARNNWCVKQLDFKTAYLNASVG